MEYTARRPRFQPYVRPSRRSSWPRLGFDPRVAVVPPIRRHTNPRGGNVQFRLVRDTPMDSSALRAGVGLGGRVDLFPRGRSFLRWRACRRREKWGASEQRPCRNVPDEGLTRAGYPATEAKETSWGIVGSAPVAPPAQKTEQNT